MRRILLITFIISVHLISFSCHKSSGGNVSPASVNIINAMATSQPIIPVFGTTGAIQYFSNAQTVSYTSSVLYSPLSGSNSLYIVQQTGTDTLLTDTKRMMFNGSLNLTAGGIYSFFLAGDTTKPDTLFVQDNIPYYSDSSAGVRIVNLSPGSQPISVNIQGNLPSQMEFSGLTYKGISSFKKYPANSSIPGNYSFELRDQASGSLLATFTWNYALFKNNTVVIAGSEALGSSTPLQAFQINNF